MTEADPSTFCDAPGDMPEGAGTSGASATVWASAADSFGRWRRGDARAMDDLVRAMTPILWHVVRSYGLDAMLVEDVVQVTWMTLVRKHETIRDPQAVAGWLMTSARREAWRAGRAHRQVRSVDDADLEPHLVPDASAEAVAHLADRDRRLWAAVSTLDERCRRLLRILAFEDRPDYARIARHLSMPIGSIGPTRGRCVGKLRVALEADGWKGDPRDL